jgi:hypothetical protein
MTKDERRAIAKHAGRSSLGFSLRIGPVLLHTGGDGRGYLSVKITRKWEIIAGKVGIEPKWRINRSRQFDYRTRVKTDRCECGKWLELRGWSDWTLSQWLFCPRCRYRYKTREMLAAAHAAHEASNQERTPE